MSARGVGEIDITARMSPVPHLERGERDQRLVQKPGPVSFCLRDRPGPQKGLCRWLVALSPSSRSPSLVPLPALCLRLAGVELPPTYAAIVYGAAVVGAAVILAWAAETAQLDISGSLAIALLALIAVLPEYAVDLYFAYTAGHKPEFTQYAAANMTGSNRLLLGLGWPLVGLVAGLGLRKAAARPEEGHRPPVTRLRPCPPGGGINTSPQAPYRAVLSCGRAVCTRSSSRSPGASRWSPPRSFLRCTRPTSGAWPRRSAPNRNLWASVRASGRCPAGERRRSGRHVRAAAAFVLAAAEPFANAWSRPGLTWASTSSCSSSGWPLWCRSLRN